MRLVTRAAGRQRLGVSIPPSCAKLFDVIGVAGAIDRAGFVRSTGNTVWWGGTESRIEPFAGGVRGWQVDLTRLERALLDEARLAGVEVVHATLPADHREPGGAGFVVDATGRTGTIARERNLRRYHDGPRTIALVGEWRGRFADLTDDSHTVIESYADGWMWSVPLAPGVRHVSAMIDPQRSDLAKGVSSRAVYLSEVAKTRAFKRLLATASLADGPVGWDASTYYATEYAGDGWLLAGDAASFIDPLSSAGVKKALASAWLGAIAVNTCLRRPGMQRHALEFFAGREREIERHHDEASRSFLASASGAHDRPFWAERSAADEADGGGRQAVRRVFDDLRRAERPSLRAAAGLRIEQRPLIEGNEIILARHVIGSNETAVRYLNGVDVVALLELAGSATQVPDLFEVYVRRVAEVTLHDFLTALSTAVARGWLVRQ